MSFGKEIGRTSDLCNPSASLAAIATDSRRRSARSNVCQSGLSAGSGDPTASYAGTAAVFAGDAATASSTTRAAPRIPIEVARGRSERSLSILYDQ